MHHENILHTPQLMTVVVEMIMIVEIGHIVKLVEVKVVLQILSKIWLIDIIALKLEYIVEPSLLIL